MTTAAHRTHRRAARRPRVLLVGLTPLMMRTLEGPLSDVAEVSAVAFPSPNFERVAGAAQPQLVVVDVTFLDESKVRPLMMSIFEPQSPMLAFVAQSGYGWLDDLGAHVSGPIEDASARALMRLVARPSLTVVEPA